MKTISEPSIISPAILVLAALAIAVIFITLNGTNLLLLSNLKVNLALLIFLGMSICTQGGIGRTAATGQWGHPLTIVGYVLGASILILAVSVFFNLNLPFLASQLQSFIIIAVLMAVKVLNAFVHYYFLYFTDVFETLRGCLALLRDKGRLAVFFDQSCGPDTPLQEYPSEITGVDNTELAQAFRKLGLSYQSWDYSEAMLAHLLRRRPVLDALKSQFEAEGNLFLYESHLGESFGIERAYTHNAGKRYLYLARRS